MLPRHSFYFTLVADVCATYNILLVRQRRFVPMNLPLQIEIESFAFVNVGIVQQERVEKPIVRKWCSIVGECNGANTIAKKYASRLCYARLRPVRPPVLQDDRPQELQAAHREGVQLFCFGMVTLVGKT